MGANQTTGKQYFESEWKDVAVKTVSGNTSVLIPIAVDDPERWAKIRILFQCRTGGSATKIFETGGGEPNSGSSTIYLVNTSNALSGALAGSDAIFPNQEVTTYTDTADETESFTVESTVPLTTALRGADSGFGIDANTDILSKGTAYSSSSNNFWAGKQMLLECGAIGKHLAVLGICGTASNGTVEGTFSYKIFGYR